MVGCGNPDILWSLAGVLLVDDEGSEGEMKVDGLELQQTRKQRRGARRIPRKEEKRAANEFWNQLMKSIEQMKRGELIPWEDVKAEFGL